MRKLIYLIVAVSVLWGGYWFVGSRAVETGFREWLDQERNNGWRTQYSQLGTRGFPNRFDTTISDLLVQDTSVGWAWSAPFFQVFALSYKPNHIIAVWPPKQTVQIRNQIVTLENDQMQASVVFEPDTSLNLERVVLELENIRLNSDDDWDASAQNAVFSVRQAIGRPNSYDYAIDARDVRAASLYQALMGVQSANDIPKGDAVFRATYTYDRPWDRFAAEGQTPVIQAIDFQTFQIKWGDLSLTAKGKIDVDDSGYPTGKIDISAKNWRTMFQSALNAGLVAQDTSKTFEGFLEILANMSGDSETLEAPLQFKNGRMAFGPIPLGPAPRFLRR